MVKLSQPDPQLLHSALHPLLVQCLFCRSSVGFMVAGTSVEDGSALCGGDFGGGSDGSAGASSSAAVGGNSSNASFSSGAASSSAPPFAGGFGCRRGIGRASPCSAAPVVNDR
ncbi:hypothetical protein TcCL_Unassigned03350 [Trypanosoma cruzi]|nr:hypothetical protein TcCL_Unassigned03350 [Trypanosoma cruzi]